MYSMHGYFVAGSPQVTLCQAWSSDFFKTRLIRAAAAAALGAVSCDGCKKQVSSRHGRCKKARKNYYQQMPLFQRRKKYCIFWVWSVGNMKISIALNVAKSQNLCLPHRTEELRCGYGEVLGVRYWQTSFAYVLSTPIYFLWFREVT